MISKGSALSLKFSSVQELLFPLRLYIVNRTEHVTDSSNKTGNEILSIILHFQM